MLKITPVTQGSTTKLILEGKLVSPWTDELQKTWDELRKAHPEHTVVLDLKDVTSVSDQGQRLLRQMKMDGTVFNCSRGVHTMHVLRNLVRGPGCFGSREKEEDR